MIKFIKNDNELLPLLQSPLYFFDTINILQTGSDRQNIINSLPTDIKDQFLFSLTVKDRCCFPRFNLDYFKPLDLDNHPILNKLPDLKIRTNESLTAITDNRAIALLKRAKDFDKVKLFWSGGIDSTLILAAILKNWNTADLEKLIIIGNEHSVNENKFMYENFIKDKINIEIFDNYIADNIQFSDRILYVTGDGGDPIGSGPGICEFDEMYPNIFLQSWKEHRNKIIDYFATKTEIRFGMPHHVFDREDNAKKSFQWIADSIEYHNIGIESIYDFLWWMNFNFGFNIDISYQLWAYFRIPSITTVDSMWSNNIFSWFEHMDYQYWSLSTIATDEKITNDILMNKNAFKKYIFDVDKNEDYYKNKRKESSMPKNFNKFNQYTDNRLLFIDRQNVAYYR
jgi:hypothetical protein